MFRNCTFDGHVVLDGNAYEGCTFKGAVLEFRGEKPVSFTDCTWDGCEWRLTGAAGRTVDFLQGISSQGQAGADLVASLFERKIDIR